MHAPTQLEGPRPAQLGERDELIAMINYVFRISANRKPTIARDWGHVYVPENLANVVVFCDPAKIGDTREGIGNIVASTGVWPNEVVAGQGTLRVGGINCVGTLPEYRRLGLGAQLMHAATVRMREIGCAVGLLSTGITNWYRRMGWEEAGTIRTYRFNRGNLALLPSLAPGQQLRLATFAEAAADHDAFIAQLLRLYETARLGGTRTVESFHQLIIARQVERVAVVELASGVVSAYLLLNEHSIVEWAGEAAEVAALIRATFEALDSPSGSTTRRPSDGKGESVPLALRTLTLQTPGGANDLVALLDERRIPYSTEYLGMLIVLDPQAILDAYGIQDVQVVEADREFDITYKGEQITLDRNQLTKLFFGPERISPFAADLFPLPFWQWGIERV